MTKRGFTPNEIATLDGLIRHPLLNDRELSQKTGINISTVTAIRRRMTRSGYIHQIVIPNFQLLGAELLTIGYGRIGTRKGTIPVKALTQALAEDPSVFNLAISRDHGTCACYHRDYTRARQTMDRIESFLIDNDLYDGERWRFALFPLELSKILNNFNHSTLFRRRFGLEGEPFEINLDFERRERESLSDKEREVLRGLVAFPSLPDKAIGRRVGASRQAVSKMKKRFLRQGLITMRYTLDLRKFEFDIFAMAHSRFDPAAPLRERKQGVDFIVNKVPQFMLVSGNGENVFASAFASYQELNDVRAEVMRVYKQKGYFNGEPELTIFPLKDTAVIRYHDYVPGLTDLLGMKPLPKD